jgi:hypothetical protein
MFWKPFRYQLIAERRNAALIWVFCGRRCDGKGEGGIPIVRSHRDRPPIYLSVTPSGGRNGIHCGYPGEEAVQRQGQPRPRLTAGMRMIDASCQ